MQPVAHSRYWAFFGLASAGLAADLATKRFMFAWPKLQPPGAVYWVVPEFAGFQTSLNEGAMFGLGQGQQLWFALLSIAAAIAIPVWLFAFRAASDWWLTAPLGLVSGGILGNLYDRLGLFGAQWGVDWPALGDHQSGEAIHAVRDWILLQANDAWRWPNFNLADSFLVVGAGVLFVRSLLADTADANTRTGEPQQRDAETDSPPTVR